jgi:hypothetical protein
MAGTAAAARERLAAGRCSQAHDLVRGSRHEPAALAQALASPGAPGGAIEVLLLETSN